MLHPNDGSAGVAILRSIQLAGSMASASQMTRHSPILLDRHAASYDSGKMGSVEATQQLVQCAADAAKFVRARLAQQLAGPSYDREAEAAARLLLDGQQQVTPWYDAPMVRSMVAELHALAVDSADDLEDFGRTF